MPHWMADKAPVWEAIRARHGLALPLTGVASWEFADFFLGMDYDVLYSMTAARAAGFTGFVDSWRCRGADRRLRAAESCRRHRRRCWLAGDHRP